MSEAANSDSVKKVNDDYSSAGQVTPDQLKQAATEGFQSVLNVRLPDESGVLPDEQQQAEAAGLSYASAPLNNAEPTADQVSKALWELDQLPKPVLVHCGAGGRATAIAIIATAVEEGLTLEQLKERAEALGINLEQPHLKLFIEQRYS